MIDHFYQLVEKILVSIIYSQAISRKPVESRSNFDTVSWRSDLYAQEHGHPMLKRRHMEFTIGSMNVMHGENMHTAAIQHKLPAGVGDYLFERLRLTANHMVNS